MIAFDKVTRNSAAVHDLNRHVFVFISHNLPNDGNREEMIETHFNL